jgi:hypothetical protein
MSHAQNQGQSACDRRYVWHETQTIQCDGNRPICTRCADRGFTCVFNAEPDAPPIVALKRKYEALQVENDGVNQLLSQLKSVSHSDALRILEKIRGGQDVASTVEYAKSLPAPDAPAERLVSTFRGQNVIDRTLTPVPYGGFSSNASVALDLNGGIDRLDRISSFRPEVQAVSTNITLPPLSSLMYVNPLPTSTQLLTL